MMGDCHVRFCERFRGEVPLYLLDFNSYQRVTAKENKNNTFQDQEKITALDLNWIQFKWRNHDPTIGRFFNVDPLAEDYFNNSPYAFSENKVVVHIELEGLESVYVFDKDVRPQDNGTNGKTYSGEIYVKQEDGTVSGPFRASTYPNSKSNSDNGTNSNTVDEGEHNYSNKFGHDGGTEKGLNLGQNDVDKMEERRSPGTDPEGNDVTMQYVNVHSGQSDNGNYNSRGSAGCLTIHPDDADEFFSLFDFSNGTTGDASGIITIYRGDSEKSKQARDELKNNNEDEEPERKPRFER